MRGVVQSISSKLNQRVAGLVNERRVPGVAAGLVDREGLVWSEGFGFADMSTGRTPNEDTVFRIGSITKTFTATAIVQLRDAGKLHLDDPITRHIPEFTAVKCRDGSLEEVTLRRLLSHRSGLQSEPSGRNWDVWESPTIEEIVEALPRTEVVIRPDSAFKYSNLGFALLGEVVSRVSGRTYENYLQDEMLSPLRMSSSGLTLRQETSARCAMGYRASPFNDYPVPSMHKSLRGESSAGQLYSTVSDLARWIALQLRAGRNNDGLEILSGRSLEEMHRPLYLEQDWKTGYGLGWMSGRNGEDISVGHGGNVQGFTTQVRFYPKHNAGLIALTNSNAGPADDIVTAMSEVVLPAVGDAAEEVDRHLPVPVPAELERFLGRYVSGEGSLFVVRWGRGTLEVPLGQAPAVKLEATQDEDVFLATNGRWAGETLTFRTVNGRVVGFLHYETLYRRLEAGDDPAP